MEGLDTQVYSPVLRLKTGESTAMPLLASDIKSRLLPLFVVPPPNEKDAELGRHLIPAELVAVPARRLGRAWPMRPSLLDPKFLFEKLEVGSAHVWLPELFRLARSHSANPWPVADIVDIEQFMRPGLSAVLVGSKTPLALRLRPEDIEDDSLATRVQRVLLSLVRKPSETLLVLDFGNTDYSDTSLVAEVMVATLERVLAIGDWLQVIWHATSYPETNRAPAGDIAILARGEWKAYREAWELDPIIKRHVMFGDFAADSAKFNFSNVNGVVPIAHFRYSTPDKWLISRGAKDGKLATEMPKVAMRITASGMFAGRAFSRGDQYIDDVLRGVRVGQASNWRCANTVHHLTRVSADVGELLGFVVEALPVGEEWEQILLDI